MRFSMSFPVLTLLLAQGCGADASALADASSIATLQADSSPTPGVPALRPSSDPLVAELSSDGIGPVKLGMTCASLVQAQLDPQPVEGGAQVGAFRIGFAPAKGGPIVSIQVRLGDLPDGLRVGTKVLKNDSTSLQALADAVGDCEPIPPNIGQSETTCRQGRITLRGAGPIGGHLTIVLKGA